jgi:hypothetical protein
MPDLAAGFGASWRDGAGLLSPVGLPWRDGASLLTVGSPFTPSIPSGGSTPTAPNLDADYVLAAANSYNVVHNVTVVDLRDDSAVSFDNMSFGTDDSSVCWTLNASGPAELFARFTTPGNTPVIAVTIDGMLWNFVIEGVRRTRNFGKSSVAVTGRSQTIIAGEPYQFPQNWINEGPATAAQLVDQAQLYTGMEVEWLLDDWLVPDKVWTFAGTPLAVAKRVAESVGAVVRSSRADFRLALMPRYRDLPNAWPTVAPDVEIHITAAMTDSYDRADQPAYNGVYVSGQQQGAVGRVYLAGTLGDRLAPLVTDLLLTDIEGVRQRGEAILGAAGPQARVQMTLPVLTGAGQPGVLELGMLCRIVGDGPTWWGAVRAVSVAVVLPSVLQVITLERHIGAIEGTVIETPAVVAPIAAWLNPVTDSAGSAVVGASGTGENGADVFNSMFVGIVGGSTGAVVWSATWAPLVSDPSPTVTSGGIDGVGHVVLPDLSVDDDWATSAGMLTLTASIDGGPPSNEIQLAISPGSYSMLAWGPVP